MSPEENKTEPAANDAAAPKAAPPPTDAPDAPQADPGQAEQAAPEEAPEWEKELDEYPLRTPEEDKRWALNIVRIWTGFAIFCILGIVTLLILGLYYE